MADGDVTLALDEQQALVLFEWLSSIEELDRSIFQHPAEEKVLWNIQAQLESILVSPFAPNYQELLVNARNSVMAGPS